MCQQVNECLWNATLECLSFFFFSLLAAVSEWGKRWTLVQHKPPAVWIQWIATVVEARFTCEDVLGDDLHLHLQGMLGGVGDLSRDVRDLADEHWGHEFRLLHPNQSSHTAFLHKNEMVKLPQTSAHTLRDPDERQPAVCSRRDGNTPHSLLRNARRPLAARWSMGVTEFLSSWHPHLISEVMCF